MAKRVTTEEFIARAKKAHGERYDYSQAKYVNGKTKVTVLCREHGPFEQLPGNHLKPAGCPQCGTKSMAAKTRSSVESFVSRAKEVHGDRYDYFQVDYRNARTKVAIMCPEHGLFEQAPYNHLLGNRCPACADRPFIDTAAFILKAKEVHGDVYDYSEVDYKSAHSPVRIGCKVHGFFLQKPDNHLTGKGCKQCSGNFLRSTDEYVLEARSLHGDKFDYSEVQYSGRNGVVTIGCPEHGSIEIRARDHLRSGGGCPGCAAYGFDQTLPAILYYLRVERFNQKPLYKIGITNRSIEERFGSIEDRSRIVVVKTWSFESGRAAFTKEKELLAMHRDDGYDGPDVLTNGNTELFTRDVLRLDA